MLRVLSTKESIDEGKLDGGAGLLLRLSMILLTILKNMALSEKHINM